ncbi:hypothetical protein FHS40_008432 [Streptomyces spectabilis]|uniref:Uncharacterized protein n=1 Tax=Streptomyces spectabilis TaxID=68270 RepID=A0A7W8EZK9_STRST|nr:hypothetical protein [Streptomyces spectabilis]
MRWMMTLGERTRPDAPGFAECPVPSKARALALVDDFGHLFTVLREWRQAYGEELTAWAIPVECDSIANLCPQLEAKWEQESELVRLDTERGGYVRVSDYRDGRPPPGTDSRAALTARPVAPCCVPPGPRTGQGGRP